MDESPVVTRFEVNRDSVLDRRSEGRAVCIGNTVIVGPGTGHHPGADDGSTAEAAPCRWPQSGGDVSDAVGIKRGLKCRDTVDLVG